ncbi:MAG: TonB-dependent receptor [Pseudomonadota bacterium]
MKYTNIRNHLLSATVLTGLVTLSGQAVMAQESEEADAVQETVIVTGSRITNTNLVSSSPVTNVGSEDLTLSNTVNAEQFLNQLPQVIPGFDSSSNNPGEGEATVDLRGLGAVRTLVLVNGRRYVTSNQSAGQVDLNTIPAALVERVDILTGGASAVYGSDAMAGVINFIMKDDFEGLEVSAGYETTQERDGDIFTGALTVGGNFDDDRGNAVVSIEYTTREAVFQADRREAQVTLVDEGREDGLGEFGSANIPSTRVADSDVNFSELLGINLPCEGESIEEAVDDDDSGLGFCTSDVGGFLFTPDGPGIQPFINSGPNTSRYNFAPENYLQIPQERYSIYGNLTYDITPDIEAYLQTVFVTTQTEQLLAPTPVGTSLTVNLDNPFLANDPVALAALTAISNTQTTTNADGVSTPDNDFDNNGVPDARISTNRRFLETQGRLSDLRTDSFQANGGLRGALSDTWNWDVFASFGQSETTITQTGNIRLSAYQEAVSDGTANIFDANGISADVIEDLSVTGMISGQTEQFIFSASASGDLGGLTLPAAETPVSVAFGSEYREENLSTRGAGLGTDVRGFNQAPDVFGEFDVREVFAEINAPIVENAPFMEEITFSGAARLSDYSLKAVGQVYSYAGGLSWTPIDGLRFRGQYQQAVRAPNIGELFTPLVNGFPNIDDPCSGGTNGAFDEYTADQQAIVTKNCEENPIASARVTPGLTGTSLQVNSQIEGLFGGNPDLEQETAETVTLGVIWSPSFIDDLTFTLDYFDIEIEDVIRTVPSQTIFDFCYLDGLTQYCEDIDRNPDGSVDIFRSRNDNLGALATSGFDVSADYQFDTDRFGTFGVYSLLTYTDSTTLVPLPGEDPIEYVGFYGSTVGEPTPQWSANTRFDWSYQEYGARLRWTHISEVDDEALAETGRADLFIPGIDPYDQFDLTLFWDVRDNVSLTFGIENLTDEGYVIIGDGSAEQSNTYPATYDTLGRTFFGRITASF